MRWGRNRPESPCVCTELLPIILIVHFRILPEVYITQNIFLCFDVYFIKFDQLLAEKMEYEDDPIDGETSEEEVQYSSDEDGGLFAFLYHFL